MTRADRANLVGMIEVGEYDPMSDLAAQFGLPLCSKGSPTGRRCTRAAGHYESIPRHPGMLHVVTGRSYVAEEVW